MNKRKLLGKSFYEKKDCHLCGHNKFKRTKTKFNCSRCGSEETKLVSYTNKHGIERLKVEVVK